MPLRSETAHGVKESLKNICREQNQDISLNILKHQAKYTTVYY